VKNANCCDAVGRTRRLLAARLLPGQDVVEGCIELIKANGFRSGTVTAIGSLRAATIVWAKSMDFGEDPMDAAVFHEMEGPVELGLAQGYFGTDQDGSVVMHIHGLIMDADGNMRCGNLLPGSAPVFATVEMSIQEMEDMELVPTLDEVFKHKFLHPMSKDKTR
jgi:predicted DNA-binding protein with PD1-like motif